jgi:hypothetical protein
MNSKEAKSVAERQRGTRARQIDGRLADQGQRAFGLHLRNYGSILHYVCTIDKFSVKAQPTTL